MGSSSSKAARAAGSAARKYPQRPSTQPPPPSRATPSTRMTDATSSSSSVFPEIASRTNVKASPTRSEAIDLDARDPQFASRLSELGPVKPYPTYSHSSTTGNHTYNGASSNSSSVIGATISGRTGIFPNPASNPAVAILAARQKISEAAEQEKIMAGRKGFGGRQYLDIATIRKILTLRDEQGMSGPDIENALGLKSGVVAKLGRVGVIEAA